MLQKLYAEKSRLSKKKGFTLVELLVVIAIIAVLVAIIIPNVQSSMGKAKAATDAANLRSAYAVIEIHLADGTWTAKGDKVYADKTGTMEITASAVGLDTTSGKSQYDGGVFACTYNATTNQATVTYGSNGISYYANIASGGSESSAAA